MRVEFWELFLLTFIVVAGGYSFLASWTNLLYRKKSWGQLTQAELKIKQGSATFENRIDLFMRTIFASLFTYQIYLLSFVLSGCVYLIMQFINV